MAPVNLRQPCPKCRRTVPYGNGVMRNGQRLHFWCAVTLKDHGGGEVRLPSGAYV